jgi:RNA polymerase sigma-70 factor (ECF subfamily)
MYVMRTNSEEKALARPTFQSLLEQYGRELFAYLWRMLGDMQQAEDCLQDTYLRAFRAFEKTAADWNYRAWLYKIATNVARTHLKRERRSDNRLDGLIDHVQHDPLDVVTHHDDVEQVLKAMEQLSFRQRTAIMMRKYSDLDYAMIGEALDCSPDTARAHVYQGLKRLRARLLVDSERGGKAHG